MREEISTSSGPTIRMGEPSKWIDWLFSQPPFLVSSLVGIAFFVAAISARLFVTPPDLLAPVWISTAVLIFALLRARDRTTSILTTVFAYITGFLANIVTGIHLFPDLFISAVNCIAAIVGLLLLKRKLGTCLRLDTVRQLVDLLIYGAASSAVGAVLGATALVAFHLGNPVRAFIVWWLSNTLGTLIILPFFTEAPRLRIPNTMTASRFLLETGLIAALSALILAVGLGHHRTFSATILVFPLMVVVGLRFGVSGAAISSFVLPLAILLIRSFTALTGATETISVGNIELQVFIITAVISSLVPAAALAERVRAMEALHSSEHSLRESEERLELFIKYAPAGLAMFNRDMRYLYASERWKRDYGIEGRDLKGLSHYELFPEISDRWKKVHQEALAGRVSSSEGDLFVRADGSHQWTRWEVRPWKTTSGDVGGIVIVAEEISERKNTEEKLRTTEARWNSVLQNIGDSLVVSDEEGRLLYRNPAASQMHGLDSSEESLRELQDLSKVFQLWTVDSATMLSLDEWPMARIRRGEEINKLELLVRRPNKNFERIVSYSGALITTSTGERLIYLSGVDLTALRKAEWEQLESERLFRVVAENIPQIIWVDNMRGELTYLSPKWIEFTGTQLAPNDTGGWLNSVHPDDRERAATTWTNAIEKGEIFETEYRLRRADGEYRWQLARAVPVRNGRDKQTLWFGTVTDIETQRRSQNALIRTEKLASVGRMAATIAHEVNNPLAAAINAVYIAKRAQGLPPQAEHVLTLAEHELARAAQITKQTLGFYRDASEPKSVSLGELVEEVLVLYQQKLTSKNIQVRRELDPNIIAFAVEGEVRQVFSNLITNAIDAAPVNGTIWLRLSGPTSLKSKMVKFTVADNGPGISRENLQRIFEPFFTTKESFGTGLGLWVAKELLRKQSGNIRVHCISRRTVFTVWLPLERRARNRLAS